MGKNGLDLTLTLQMRLQLAALKGSLLSAIDSSAAISHQRFFGDALLRTNCGTLQLTNDLTSAVLFGVENEVSHFSIRKLKSDENCDVWPANNGGVKVGGVIAGIWIANDCINADSDDSFCRMDAIVFKVGDRFYSFVPEIFFSELFDLWVGDSLADAVRPIESIVDEFDNPPKLRASVKREFIEL